jgi:hypothetical protein
MNAAVCAPGLGLTVHVLCARMYSGAGWPGAPLHNRPKYSTADGQNHLYYADDDNKWLFDTDFEQSGYYAYLLRPYGQQVKSSQVCH